MIWNLGLQMSFQETSLTSSFCRHTSRTFSVIQKALDRGTVNPCRFIIIFSLKMPHSPITTLFGIHCIKRSQNAYGTFSHRKEIWWFLYRKKYSMTNKESCQQKGHLKAIWKNRPQIKSGDPLELLQIFISSLALGSSIFLLIC